MRRSGGRGERVRDKLEGTGQKGWKKTRVCAYRDYHPEPRREPKVLEFLQSSTLSKYL